jgi:hypothetical protein
MNRFREHFLSKLITIITTLVFLNMSFLLAEVSLLKLEKDSRFAKIIILILSGTCFEEEREVGGDLAEEDASGKKIDLAFSYLIHASGVTELPVGDNKFISDHRIPLGGNYETFSPPPES